MKRKQVKLDDLMPVFLEQLEQNGKVAFTPAGTSMKPMLDHRCDEVYLEKVDRDTVRKWDVVLYKTEQGAYVMHRVINLQPKGFITRGDNLYCKDAFQTYDRMIGKVCQFVHKGKKHSTTDFSYRCYVAFWVITYWPRKIVRGVLRRILRRK